jgi:predicted nucleotidyltransferase component of viral defense system
MKRRGKPVNTAASVRDRLLKLAKQNGEDFTYVLTRYALERLLARLAASKHREAFLLKGAMLFRVWSTATHRPTKDLDLLGSGSPDLGRLAAVFVDICEAVVDDDGVVMDPKSVRAGRIKEDADYEGVRVNMVARIGTARLDLQVDVGFGDAVSPGVVEVDYPTLLGAPPPRLRAYPREAVVAEKLQAMVHLGIANSRMKDFFDVWFLARTYAFDGNLLSTAIRATFERRGTALPAEPPVAFTDLFHQDATKKAQWRAFMARSRLTNAALESVVADLAAFLEPPLAAARAAAAFDADWVPLGPWRLR